MAAEKIVSEEVEIELADSEFSAIRIDEFFTGGSAILDVHVRLGAGKFLRIFKAGDSYDEEKVRFYEEDRGIRFLYLAKKDRGKYVDFSRRLLVKITTLPKFPVKTKFAIVRNLYEKYVEELFSEGLNDPFLNQGKEICEGIVACVEATPDLRARLLAFDRFEPTISSHAFLAGMFSVYISRNFKWTSKQISEQLLFASMLSNIGLRELPPELAKIKPAKMSKAQRGEYEKHPDLSFRMIEEIDCVNNVVKQVVLQHHESCDSNGYPNRTPSDRIVPLAKVLALSDDFARCIIDYLSPAKDAISIMFPDRSEQIFVDSGKGIVKYDKATLIEFFRLFDGGN